MTDPGDSAGDINVIDDEYDDDDDAGNRMSGGRRSPSSPIW